jgi:protein KRI1
MTKRLLEVDGDEPVEFRVNTKFAENYTTKKRHEELSILEDKYRERLAHKGVTNSLDKDADSEDGDSETDSEEDVVEDEDGELATPAVEVQILKTLAEIRARDERIYNPNVNFFDPEELEKAERHWREKQIRAKREGKPLTLKDYHRERILAGDNEEETCVKTHEEEQEDLKNAFKVAAEKALPVEESDSLLKLRPKTDEDLERENEEYRKFILDNLAQSEHAKDSMSEWFYQNSANLGKDEAFLIDYVLNRGWVDHDRKVLPTYDQIVAEEEDEDAVDKMEEFEEKYNFRYEQPGGDQITTFSRHIEGSMRREPDSKRKSLREAKKNREGIEKERQREELKRLKNLKRAEIGEKLKRIQAISGNDRIGDDIDLESDFDPERHDSRMGALFGDSYYGEDDKNRPIWTDSEAEADLQGDDPVDKEAQEKVIKKAARSLAKAQKKVVKAAQLAKETANAAQLTEYLDEYYQLDYEDMVAGIPCRFKYTQVRPTTFGLKVKDIWTADDADLNSHVSLKKLAPYRSEEVLQADEARYGNKGRIYKFYDTLKKRREEREGGEGGEVKGRKSSNIKQ